MSIDARRKEKQRLKREKKKAQMRRELSVSPYKRIGQAGEIEACYINSDWKQNGLASIHVIRRNPAGGHAMACFLIDVWCAGLKDAWGRIDLMKEDIDHNLKRARENFDLERIDVEVVRRLVAGSIRFARQNGFRLPDHYDRWINVLGGVGDVSTLPLSDFGKDGKLCWVGPMEDLRRRLIGCTPDEFMRRPDVQYIAEVPGDEFDIDDADDWDDEYEAEFERRVNRIRRIIESKARALVSQVSNWCVEQAQPPCKHLEQAILILFALMAREEYEDAAEDDDGSAPVICTAAEDILCDISEELVTANCPASAVPQFLRPAYDQADRYFREVQWDEAEEELAELESRQIIDPEL